MAVASPVSRAFPPWLLRGLTATTSLLVGSMMVSSCLTPDFSFSDNSSNLGGSNSIDQCENRKLDEGETDKDCGGPCPLCPIGSKCVITRDCEPPPSDDPAVVECVDGVCALDCQRNYADCNGRANDGCEVNLLADLYNCGSCDSICAPANATGECVNGECLIDTARDNQGCDDEYANCNLELSDGCEVHLSSDPDHCGACEDAACSDNNGTPMCTGGACTIDCAEGFDDCDDDAGANGCETRTSSSVNDCGRCGYECPDSGDDWYPFCKDGACDETECLNGQADCDGDGNCTDALDTVDNCGGCGVLCSVQNGSPACDSDSCIVAACNNGEGEAWADCDSDYATGCEVNTMSSRTRCGGCLAAEGGNGQDCSLIEGTEHVTISTCSAGACSVASCDSGWVDCDDSFSNGCEIDTNSDEDNCGGCADAGGEVCVSKAHTVSQCMGGSCNYSCEVGWSDRDGDRYESDSNGCEDVTLRIENFGTRGSADTGGSGPGVTINHILEGVRGTQRLVLVGVVCRGSSSTDCTMTTATYGGVALKRLNTAGQSFLTDSGVEMFYLLDADLPAPGTYPVVIDRNDAWGSISIDVVEFSGAEQDTFYAAAAGATKNANCNDGADATVQLSGLPPESAVYAVSGGHYEGVQSSAAAVAPLALSSSSTENYITFGATYGTRLSGNVSVTMNLAGCYRSVIYAVGIRPESNY